MLCESSRTRSTTRASRVEVEKTRVPQAEMSTAGVIIEVSRSRPLGKGFKHHHAVRRPRP